MSVVVADTIKASAGTLTSESVLQSPLTVLLGVPAAVQPLLNGLGIRTVFDLAASSVFATAARLVALETDATLAEARLNTIAFDAVTAPAGVPASELSRQAPTILKDIDAARANDLATLLDIRTVRDLALWPPYRAALGILQATFVAAQPEVDLEAPAELLPTTGVYPTERVFYRRLVIDLAPQPATGITPLETTDPIDLGTILSTPVAFDRIATGALLTFSQSWFSQGVTLGQLLHSLSLAPGESTRVAMIDWTRRTRAATTEDITEAESLSNTEAHTRAISEVTSASATEFQAGTSSSSTTSSTDQGGVGFGLEIGPLALGGAGGSSSTTTEAMSASSSFGVRDMAAQLAQSINDRSQQNASSSRNRRASIVREVSQEEHEGISTRVVTNYNHMHALTVQYYEVVQAYRVTSQLDRAERCLFIPLKLLSFKDPAVVDRLRPILAAAALTPAAFRQLTSEYGVVEIIPQTPRVVPGRVIIGDVFSGGVLAGNVVTGTTGAGGTTTTGGGTATGGGVLGGGVLGGVGGTVIRAGTRAAPAAAAATTVRFDLGPAGAATTVLAVKGWDVEQLNRLAVKSGRVLVRTGSDSAFVPDEALLLGIALRSGQAAKFSVKKRDNSEVAALETTGTSVLLGTPVRFADLQSVGIQNAGDTEVKTTLVLSVSVQGAVVPLDVPVVIRPKGANPVVSDVIRFGPVRASGELIDHLENNRLHYSRAVFRTLDSATIAGLLAKFTYRGLPLTQVVEPQPLAVTANFLVFRVNVPLQGELEDPKFADEQADFNKFLTSHGLKAPVPKTEVIPLPSGGVFAEAVLGRFNSAERIDLKRFWNWQDSPIPITAPEIAPVAAGSRAQTEDLRPGQLGAPVVTIQSPTTLPGAAGVNPILAAVQNGAIFRDMSGLAQTAALAQGAAQASGAGATAAGAQVAKNLQTVMDQHTQRMKIAADMLGSMMGASAAGAGGNSGGSGLPAGRNTVSERGGQLGAAQTIDAARAGGGTAGATPAVDAISGADAATPPSLREETLRTQSGGDATTAAQRVVDAATAPDTTPKPAAKPPKTSTGSGSTGSTTTGSGGSQGTGGSQAPVPPLIRRYRINIQFIPSQGVAIAGTSHVKVVDHAGTQFETLGDPGQTISGFFETGDEAVSFSVGVFAKPAAVRMDGFKTVLFPPVTIAELVAAAGGGKAETNLSLSVQPVIRTTTIRIASSTTLPIPAPDLNDLDRQLAALGIKSEQVIGSPKFDADLSGSTPQFKATVKAFTQVLSITQTL